MSPLAAALYIQRQLVLFQAATRGCAARAAAARRRAAAARLQVDERRCTVDRVGELLGGSGGDTSNLFDGSMLSPTPTASCSAGSSGDTLVIELPDARSPTVEAAASAHAPRSPPHGPGRGAAVSCPTGEVATGAAAATADAPAPRPSPHGSGPGAPMLWYVQPQLPTPPSEAVRLAPGPTLAHLRLGGRPTGHSGGGGHTSALPVTPPETLVIELPGARSPTDEAAAGAPAPRSPTHFAMGARQRRHGQRHMRARARASRRARPTIL